MYIDPLYYELLYLSFIPSPNFLGAFHNSPDDNGLRLTLDKFVVADDDGECKANPLLKFFKIDPLKRPSYLSEVYLITESL